MFEFLVALYVVLGFRADFVLGWLCYLVSFGWVFGGFRFLIVIWMLGLLLCLFGMLLYDLLLCLWVDLFGFGVWGLIWFVGLLFLWFGFGWLERCLMAAIGMGVVRCLLLLIILFKFYYFGLYAVGLGCWFLQIRLLGLGDVCC